MRNIQGNEAIVMIPGVLGHCSLPEKRYLNCYHPPLTTTAGSTGDWTLPEWVGEPQEVVNVNGSFAMY